MTRLVAARAAAVVLAVVAATAACASPAPTGAGTATGTATGTGTAPVSVDELGKGDQTAAVDVQVPGPVQVAFRRITIAPGAGTGKHCHDGQLVAVVEQGELTHYAPDHPGGVAVYRAGESVVEGAHYVHEGKNLGSVPLVLLVTYVIPEGRPLAETDLSRCDPVPTVSTPPTG